MADIRPAIWILLISLLVASGCRARVEPVSHATPLAAVQAAVSERLGMAVSLRTDVLHRNGDWVFVSGLPLTVEQQRIDYTDTAYAEDLAAGYFDDHFMALVQRSQIVDGGWQLVELSIGATDAPFVGWFERHGLPLTMADPDSGPGRGLPDR